MTFDELQSGDSLFLDANIFTYHFSGISADCHHLIERCAYKELIGFTSTTVLAEVLHRLMVAEALRKQLTRPKNPVQQLKTHPEIITQLEDYQRDVAQIWDMNIRILTVTRQCIHESETIRQAEGLLTNDSLILAVMRPAHLTRLATNDNDFNRITWLEVYQPTDILKRGT